MHLFLQEKCIHLMLNYVKCFLINFITLLALSLYALRWSDIVSALETMRLIMSGPNGGHISPVFNRKPCSHF